MDSDGQRNGGALRARLARMSEASLRITETLDFDSVLQEVVDSACLLTNARCGGITVLDEQGHFRDVATSGLTPEEHRKMLDFPGAQALREYFSLVAGPMRSTNLSAYTDMAGMPGLVLPEPVNSMTSFLTAPIRYRAESLGAIYLAHDGHEFTQEDEDTLVMFASQAALVLGNARRYRDEQRARAAMETLIETAPVGVAVFDARTGEPVSFNREALRIFEPLRMPGQPPKKIINFLTLRWADGRSVSLGESPLKTLLATAGTVRGEEVTAELPDGRSVTTLVNCTPIADADGGVETVVVTMQDLAPIEELDRLRAGILGMANHELRGPLAAIRGSASTLLDAGTDLNPAEAREFHRVIFEQSERMRSLMGDLLDVAQVETGTMSVAPRPESVSDLISDARESFVSAGGRHEVVTDIPADLPRVAVDRRRILQVLSNLLRNASLQSPRSAGIRVTARQDGLNVAVAVADRGAGISVEQQRRLFQKYVRTDEDDGARDMGGSGLSLAICRGIVEAHGGRIWAESDGPGQGARFTFTVPTADEEAARAAIERSRERTADSAYDLVRILVVEDDLSTLRHIRQALFNEGYTLTVTADPAEVARLVTDEKPQLALLGPVVHGPAGVDLMTRLSDIADVSVIFLSEYRDERAISSALDMGAADYLVIPFSATELAARVRAVLRNRRAVQAAIPDTFDLGELTINYPTRSASLNGSPLEFTPTEFRLLVELALNMGRVVTLEQLLSRVWPSDSPAGVKSIRTAVKNIRRKIGDNPANPRYIVNQRGVGYRMLDPESQS